ncbi:GIY-YIG nuclease family protein [Lewinella cohaerens]
MLHHVYILYSPSKDRYYTGYSSNVNDRLERHNGGRSKSTRSGQFFLV